MTDQERPEIGKRVDAAGISTNYLEAGDGPEIVLVHGSGPGVSAYANWRLIMPVLAKHFHVYAPDMVGFGFSDRPDGIEYTMETWLKQLVGFFDAMDIDQAGVVGNSFGGGLVIRMAVEHAGRIGRLALMGAVGVEFPITPALDAIWGYEPSVEEMKRDLHLFAYSDKYATDELAQVRYQASIEPGMQEAFSAMFPAPRQRWVDAMATPEDQIRQIPHETLIVHGRDDQVIPVENTIRLNRLIERSEAHIYGQCGHWTQIERSDDFSQLLVDFFSRPSRE